MSTTTAVESINLSKIVSNNYLSANRYLFMDVFSAPQKKPRNNELVAIDSINFTVQSGEQIGITGSMNGSESILGKLIAGMSVPTSGQIKSYGKTAYLAKPSAGFKSFLSIEENARLRLATWNEPVRSIPKKLKQSLEMANLTQSSHKLMINSSPNEIRQLAYALLIVYDADIYILDNFFPWLKASDTLTQNLQKFLCSKTVFFIGSPEEVSLLTNKALVLENGKLVHSGVLTSEICKYLKNSNPSRVLNQINNALDDTEDEESFSEVDSMPYDNGSNPKSTQTQLKSVSINRNNFDFDTTCLLIQPSEPCSFKIRLRATVSLHIKEIHLQIHSRFNPIALSRNPILKTEAPFYLDQNEECALSFEAYLPLLHRGVYGLAIEVRLSGEHNAKNEIHKLARFGFLACPTAGEGVFMPINNASLRKPEDTA